MKTFHRVIGHCGQACERNERSANSRRKEEEDDEIVIVEEEEE